MRKTLVVDGLTFTRDHAGHWFFTVYVNWLSCPQFWLTVVLEREETGRRVGCNIRMGHTRNRGIVTASSHGYSYAAALRRTWVLLPQLEELWIRRFMMGGYAT